MVRRLVTMILPLLAALPAGARGGRPNIVLFLVDDLGLMETSVPFLDSLHESNLRFRTPNIEALAEKGVVMTSAYACPLSTPTRAALMSGMNAAHNHVTSFTATIRDTPSDASAGTGGEYQIRENDEDIFRRGDWNWNGISPVEECPATRFITPYPAVFAENSYFTVHAGKSHWAPSGTPGSSGLRPGRRISSPVMPEDFYPSIMELAGIWDYSTVQPLDGESFVRFLRRDVPEDRFIVTHFPHQWRADDQPDIDFLSSIRYGKWKLVYRMHDAMLELYDLSEDIGERRNVAGLHPDIVKVLAVELSARLRKWDATMPVIRSSGSMVPFPMKYYEYAYQNQTICNLCRGGVRHPSGLCNGIGADSF